MRPLRRILAVAWIEALQVLRDRAALSLVLVTPLAQILLFGFAIQLEPGGAPVALAGPGSARGEAVAGALAHEPEVAVVASGLPSGEGEARVRAGRALIAVELPPPPAPGSYAPPAPVRVVVDAADPAASGPALAALARRASGISASRPVEIVRLFNPDRRSAWTLVPGLVGVIVMIAMLMLGGQALVREREAGTWEGLLATPVTAAEALAGKLLPYLAVALLQTAAALLLCRVVFDLPLRGAWGALLLATPLFAAAHLLLGLALSAVAATRIQAIQGAIFVYLPSILLSGFMFPVRGMPGWAQALSQALPLTHWVKASRDALLRGAGAEAVWREMMPVAAFAAVAGAAAVALYGRRRS